MSNKSILFRALVFPFFIGLFLVFCSFIKSSSNCSITNHSIPIDSVKTAAFIVLENKCNACHRISKTDILFTKENMDSFAFSIHKQVFKKRKMPKGKANKLTDKESEDLRRWLDRIEVN